MRRSPWRKVLIISLSIVGLILLFFGWVIGVFVSDFLDYLSKIEVESYEAPVHDTRLLSRFEKAPSFLPEWSQAERILPLNSEKILIPYPPKQKIISLIPTYATVIIESYPHPFQKRWSKYSVEFHPISFVAQANADSRGLMKAWSWFGREFGYMTVGRYGDLWTSASTSIMRWDGERIETISLPEEIQLSTAPSIYEDTSGVWVVLKDTLLFYDGFYWYAKSALSPSERAFMAPSGGFISAEAWKDRLFWYTKDSAFALVFPSFRVLPIGWIGDTLLIAFDHNKGQGLLLWRAGKVQALYATRPLWNQFTSVVAGEGKNKAIFTSDRGTFVYSDGNLWYAGEAAPYHLDQLIISAHNSIRGTTKTHSFSMDSSGQWIFSEVKEDVRTNLICVGFSGELWAGRCFSSEKIIAVFRDDLVEKVPFPSQAEVQDFLTIRDTLWVLTQKGEVWRWGGGVAWERLRFPFRTVQAKLIPDATGRAVWVTGPFPLLRASAVGWEIFSIDSVESICQTEDGKIWLLRRSILYQGNRPLPWKDVKFIAKGVHGALWVVRNSGVYLLQGDTLWEVEKGSYEGLTVDNKGRLWGEQAAKRGRSALCWRVYRNQNGLMERELFALGPEQGLDRMLYFIGGQDTLWWQGEGHRLFGLLARNVAFRQVKIRTYITVSVASQPAYVSLLCPLNVSKLMGFRWSGKQGYLFQTQEGLLWYEEKPRSPLASPRLRVRWHLTYPWVPEGWSSLEKMELGTSSVEGKMEQPGLRLLESKGIWPSISLIPFEASYFSYDLTFNFSLVQGLLELPDVEYQYRLRGYREQWSRPSREGKAYFYHLPEGRYVLEVRARPVGGSWGPSAEWSFRINPPPWRSPWAFALYGLLVLGGIFLYVRYRLRALRRQAAKLQEEVKKAVSTIQAQNEALIAANQELAAQRDLIETQRQNLVDSLIYAQRIQNALLPSPFILSQFFPNNFILFLPRDIVSGDIYWLYARDESDGSKELFLLVADCTGHGVPGAFVSLLTLSLLERVVKENPQASPGVLLDTLSAQIIRMLNPAAGDEMKDGFEGVLCRFYQVESVWQMEYAAARRSFWLVRNGEPTELPKDPLPVGLSEIPALRGVSFTTHSLRLEKGDWLYFSTDGYTDQLGGEEGRRFGSKRFRALLAELCHLPAEKQRERLQETLVRWREPRQLPQVDDVLLVGLQVPTEPID
ncbi:MAG: SpoIIE family protein phosphatase [Bacteroidia bacterium]|nr:SpoIIE family protein phosphatase [Bacteroidia bacterium]MDW8015099.1 SpoIIE family protein phosphatase [Bacteroidia bacterium]